MKLRNQQFNKDSKMNLTEKEIKKLKKEGKWTKCKPQKKRIKSVISSSASMHQKGSFGWSSPMNKNGVSSIYFSETNRKPRNGGESKSNGKLSENRAW